MHGRAALVAYIILAVGMIASVHFAQDANRAARSVDRRIATAAAERAKTDAKAYAKQLADAIKAEDARLAIANCASGNGVRQEIRDLLGPLAARVPLRDCAADGFPALPEPTSTTIAPAATGPRVPRRPSPPTFKLPPIEPAPAPAPPTTTAKRHGPPTTRPPVCVPPALCMPVPTVPPIPKKAP